MMKAILKAEKGEERMVGRWRRKVELLLQRYSDPHPYMTMAVTEGIHPYPCYSATLAPIVEDGDKCLLELHRSFGLVPSECLQIKPTCITLIEEVGKESILLVWRILRVRQCSSRSPFSRSPFSRRRRCNSYRWSTKLSISGCTPVKRGRTFWLLHGQI
jgi:hypothetical protein